MPKLPARVDVLEPVSHVEPLVRVKGRPARRSGESPMRFDLPEAMVERFASFMENDDYLDLRDEIALLRSMLSQQLVQWKDWERSAFKARRAGSDDIPEPPVYPKQIAEAVDQIGKMVERQHRMVTSTANLVTIEAAVVFALSVGQVVSKFVKDPDERVAVLDGIRSLLTNGAGFNIDMGVVKRLLAPVRGAEEEE